MSEATEPSDEGTAEEYRRSNHLEKYGLQQFQPSVPGQVSVSWTGSARELIHEQAQEEWDKANPRGCVVPCFERHTSVVRICTFPQAKALYGLITDELNRRQINQRQRNSLHNARDQLEEGFEEHRDKVEKWAKANWNGHQFRSKGEVPSPSIAAGDARLDAPVTDDDFIRARVKYHAGPGPSLRSSTSSYWEDKDRDRVVEKAVDEIPIMYGYDPDE